MGGRGGRGGRDDRNRREGRDGIIFDIRGIVNLEKVAACRRIRINIPTINRDRPSGTNGDQILTLHLPIQTGHQPGGVTTTIGHPQRPVAVAIVQVPSQQGFQFHHSGGLP